MATDSEKQVLDWQGYHDNGYIILKNFFHKDDVSIILHECMAVFENQFNTKGYSGSFLDKMKLLFQLDFNTFQNCGKQVQHLINLHKLSLSNRVIDVLHLAGLRWPVVCTRPVVYFNHPSLAKEKIYHTVDAHQDWRSMQGSSNAAVLWLPLVKMTKQIGALQILPGSHKNGLYADKVDHGFGMVWLSDDEERRMIDVELEVGDALLFNSFLVHRSGHHTSDEIRWSAHFRYNDLDDAEFIRRGYIHPYIYKPVEDLL